MRYRRRFEIIMPLPRDDNNAASIRFRVTSACLRLSCATSKIVVKIVFYALPPSVFVRDFRSYWMTLTPVNRLINVGGVRYEMSVTLPFYNILAYTIEFFKYLQFHSGVKRKITIYLYIRSSGTIKFNYATSLFDLRTWYTKEKKNPRSHTHLSWFTVSRIAHTPDAAWISSPLEREKIKDRKLEGRRRRRSKKKRLSGLLHDAGLMLPFFFLSGVSVMIYDLFLSRSFCGRW